MISYQGPRPGRPRTSFNIAIRLPPRSPPPNSSPSTLQSINSRSASVIRTILPCITDPDTETFLTPTIASTLPPDYSPITPPASSPIVISPRAIRRASPLRPVTHDPPSTWDELLTDITSYLSSATTIPRVTHLSPTLRDSFLDNLASASRSSPLYNLRYTYQSSTGRLTTRCMPAPEHDAIQGLFERSISSFSRVAALSDSERELFGIQTGTDVNAFGGSHQGSCKRADLSIVPQQPIGDGDNDDLDADEDAREPLNGDFPSVAVEVGFSEDYDGLLADMELWLRGSAGRVRVVVLVNLTETPDYNGAPFSRAQDPAPAPPDGSDPVPRWVSQGTYGPILYDGHVLVGELSGFVELWSFDEATSAPRMSCHRTVIPAPDVSGEDEDCFVLVLADLFGGPERVPDRLDPMMEVRFEFAVYRALLARAMREHGRQRLARAQVKKRRLEGVDGADGAWVPEAGKRRKV